MEAALLVLAFGAFWFLHPHSYSEWRVQTEPSCTETGVRQQKCFCGAKITDTIAPLGHHVAIDASVPASCTESGLTSGTHCAVCGIVLEEQKATKPLGHTIEVLKAVDPTCTEEGKTEGKGCITCGYVLTPQKSIEATGHTVVIDEATEATCLAEGITEGSHCSVCSEILVAQQKIPKTDHNMVYKPAASATCTQSGYTEGETCSVCGYSTQTVVPALGHSFSGNDCSRCGVKKWWASVYFDKAQYKVGGSITIYIHIYTNQPGATTLPYIRCEGALSSYYVFSEPGGNGEGYKLTWNTGASRTGTIYFTIYDADSYLIGSTTAEVVE